MKFGEVIICFIFAVAFAAMIIYGIDRTLEINEPQIVEVRK